MATKTTSKSNGATPLARRQKRQPATPDTAGVPVEVAATLLGKEPAAVRRLVRDGRLQKLTKYRGVQLIALPEILAMRKQQWQRTEKFAAKVVRCLEQAQREWVIETWEKGEAKKPPLRSPGST
jgi:hypothetical protein